MSCPTISATPLRVVFCWAEVTGYMAACWRSLAALPGVDLHVLHARQLTNVPNPFVVGELMKGLSHEMFEANAPGLDSWLLNAVSRRSPDVVVVCGWFFAPYRRLVRNKVFKRTIIVLGMDSPWRGGLKQRLTRYRYERFISRVDLVLAAGERSAEYARRLGVPAKNVKTGFYGFDQECFLSLARNRTRGAHEWPRQFLFLGRYVPEKGLRTLLAAYELYRREAHNPWGLTCCGGGVDAALLKDAQGVSDIGFTQPDNLPAIFAKHGVFVLPSHYEPWGVVIAEAASSGLPIICTSACGAGLDLVRPCFNGLIVPPKDHESLFRALIWMHEHEERLWQMGQRGSALAEAFASPAWAERCLYYFKEALADGFEKARL